MAFCPASHLGHDEISCNRRCGDTGSERLALGHWIDLEKSDETTKTAATEVFLFLKTVERLGGFPKRNTAPLPPRELIRLHWLNLRAPSPACFGLK
jgi:hypothetical protein